MRFRDILSLVPVLLTLTLPVFGQADDNIQCDDSDLTTYLVSTIDACYNNGLTIFEQLIANLSETDDGYTFLESLHESQTFYTILAPTDQAFQAAGINAPFTNLGSSQLVDLMSYHTISGQWAYGNLPQGPKHGTTSTLLQIKDYMNVTTVNTTLTMGMILEQGSGNTVSVRYANGNATTWSSTVDLSGTSVWNLIILPVDQVIPYPPDLTTALTLSTSSESSNGTQAFGASLNSAGLLDSLGNVTEGGMTIFAVIDEAWTATVASQGATVLGNHYATNFSLFSGFWNGQIADNYTITAATGVSITVSSNGTVTSSQGGSAQILRSDIALENGVMHIIDSPLLSTSAAPITLASSQASPTGSTEGNSASNNEKETSGGENGSGSGVGSSAGASGSGKTGGAGKLHFGFRAILGGAVIATLVLI